MRESLFIFVILLVIAVLTGIRYRKQISGMIGLARMLKVAKQNINIGPTNVKRTPEKSIPLVNCSKCGVWVPHNKAIKVGEIFFCFEHRTETR